jgi:hypothetical protein
VEIIQYYCWKSASIHSAYYFIGYTAQFTGTNSGAFRRKIPPTYSEPKSKASNKPERLKQEEEL